MTTGQIKYTRGLLTRLGMAEDTDKEQMCLTHSEGRTAHLSEMNHKETLSLQKALKMALGIPLETPNDKMQGKILSIAHDLGWHKPGTHKVDIKRVNEWCESTFKKPLNDLNYAELPKAVTAFEKVLVTNRKGF